MLAGSKRQRDNDEEEERREDSGSKKPRTLPFRASPTSQYPALPFSNRARPIPRPQVLTPVESSDEEIDIRLISLKNGGNRPPSLSLHITDADDDVDMDISESFDKPVWSPKAPDSGFVSSFPNSARSSLTGRTSSARSSTFQTPRLPTPIYGHFTAPRFPPDMTPPSPAMAPPTYINTLNYPRVRQSRGELPTDSFMRKRALPSPISEDENMDSPTVVTKAMLSSLNMDASPTREQFSSQETLTPTVSWLETADSIPRNRRRSDAISGYGGKIAFSMGYRADCDKCRERVPGHYSHVVRT